MSNPKHTPGPWQIGRHHWPVNSNGKTVYFRCVANLTSGNSSDFAEADANTRLAIAAPCLLEAIEAYLGAECPDSVQRAVDMMETAVKRAKGGAE